MYRNRKIVVVCHCLLNCNSKVEGLSIFKGAHDISKQLINNDYGIIQLPCPEMIMYGIKRWGHVKDQFDNLFFRNQCKIMLEPYIKQFCNYIENGYEIKGIIAVDGSPSCGYNLTCISKEWFGEISGCKNLDEKINTLKMVNDKGVFIEELEKLLIEHDLKIPIIGLDENIKDNTNIINKLK
ncbi:CD3072 family TudS-related putative desulfidase [Paraclostridium bifermentans]|uniref:CD3072 family TudS-related putative desulfidase n=1 Tax=Paraclostridium bifermentans TaxID=1490 RepID=UPI00359CA031